MFEGINGKVIANAWSLFDAKYGISYAEKEKSGRIIKPTDKDVWDLMMLQWNLYFQFSPQRNGSDLLYNRDFPWYNSTELMFLYPDRNELKVALFNLFCLSSATHSMNDGKSVFGVEGAKIDLLQSFEEYRRISDKHKSIIIDESEVYKQNFPISFDKYKSLIKVISGNPTEEDLLTHWYYWQWLGDRYFSGLSNTIEQFKKCDQFLKGKWKYWGFVRDIVGYERSNPKVGEIEGINYIIPGVLRIGGFPANHINIEPTPLGAANREWAVSLPSYIIKSMNEELKTQTTLSGLGYIFGLHSCKDGLINDGIKNAYIMFGDSVIYLMKRG
jgi:hypothetical protein